jgi:Tfp pilus assembly protein PilN
MIKINLLPRKARKGVFKYDLYILIFVVLVNFSVIGGIHYKNTSDIANYKKLIENTKKEIAGLDRIYKEYMSLEREKKGIKIRIQAIDNIKEGRALAARTLFDLTSIVKESVWLKKFAKKDDKFELEGRSLENESISDFIESISKIPYIKNVELKNIEDVNEGGVAIKKFIINGNISL